MKSPLVVLGATGSVGRGVVEAAVEAGWPVIAVARDADGLKQLQARHVGADLTVLAATVASDEDGARLAKALRKQGRPLGGVIASVCGGMARGRLLDHPAAYLQRRFDEDVLPHLAAARNLLPLLAEDNRGSGYLLIGGPGSEHPWAGYGHRSISAAALNMLARVLHDEARALPVRVQLLAIDSPLCTEDNRAHACPQWPSALAVGRQALSLIVKPRGKADPVVHFDPAAVDVETPPLQSSHQEQANPPLAAGDDALLPSRCLQDARTLLKNLMSPNRNQEPSSP
ncbi:SDR family NAD(P)-dependent oxidoreductase [Lysobacter niastensis]|uniref:SDR family oxidoreductase n=1 Tax=Lysobacter niastensis TaxID=380629 RepID=A0ABS0B6A2_9GAMM|nr:SDR family oxidoreductase [Lysobacter niastensis]MBF6023196.1 SDR family oxidoreductase [Lysobacter niastensis]